MQVTGRECYGARGGRVQGHYCLMEIKNNERKEIKGRLFGKSQLRVRHAEGNGVENDRHTELKPYCARIWL